MAALVDYKMYKKMSESKIFNIFVQPLYKHSISPIPVASNSNIHSPTYKKKIVKISLRELQMFNTKVKKSYNQMN